MDEAPTVTIILLGDPDCGKSTFLSCENPYVLAFSSAKH